MKKFRLFLFLVFAAVFSCGFVADDSRTAIAEKLYGDIRVVNHPGKADYKIFVTDSLGRAHLAVKIVDHSGKAYRSGLWHYVKTHGFEDYTVYFVDHPGKADISIFYTDSLGVAGPH